MFREAPAPLPYQFDFRHCNRSANGFNDAERADEALKGIYGQRLPIGGLVQSQPKLHKKRKMLGERRKR